MSTVSSLKAHPAHNVATMPRQVSRLFYTRRTDQGEHMFVARGATSKAFPTSSGIGTVIWCQDLGWKIGLVREQSGTRLMSIDELDLASHWIDARLAQTEAVARANDHLPAVEAPQPLTLAEDPGHATESDEAEDSGPGIDPEFADFMNAFPHLQEQAY